MLMMKVERPKKPAQPVGQEQLMRASLMALEKEDQRMNMARRRRALEYKAETTMTKGQQKSVRARQIARSRRTLAQASTQAHITAAERRRQVLSDLVDRNSRPEEWKEATKQTLQAREIGEALNLPATEGVEDSKSKESSKHRFTSPVRVPLTDDLKKQVQFRADSMEDTYSMQTDIDQSILSQISMDDTTPRGTEADDATPRSNKQTETKTLGPLSSRSDLTQVDERHSRLLFPPLLLETDGIVDAETGEKIQIKPKKWSFLQKKQPNNMGTQDSGLPSALNQTSNAETPQSSRMRPRKTTFPSITPKSRPDTGDLFERKKGQSEISGAKPVPDSFPEDEQNTQVLFPELSPRVRSRFNSGTTRSMNQENNFSRTRFRSDSGMEDTVSTLSSASFELLPPAPSTNWDVLKKKINLGEKPSMSLMKVVLEVKSNPGLVRTSQNVQALLQLRDRLSAQLKYLIEEEEFEEARRQDELHGCPHMKRRAQLQRRHQRERERRQRHITWFQEDAQKIIAKKLAEYDLLNV